MVHLSVVSARRPCGPIVTSERHAVTIKSRVSDGRRRVAISKV